MSTRFTVEIGAKKFREILQAEKPKIAPGEADVCRQGLAEH